MKKIKCRCGKTFTYSNGDIIKRYINKYKDRHSRTVIEITYKELVICPNCNKERILKSEKV